MIQSQSNLQILSDYRKELMGIAVIWVMLYHVSRATGIFPISHISSIGYGGVDMFLFLSGFGLCCSMHKCDNVKSFYKKRLFRIFPTYICVVLASSILLRHDYNPLHIIIKMTGIAYLLPVHSSHIPESLWNDWYVPTILAFYLIFPILYRNIKRAPYKTTIITMSTTLIATVAFIMMPEYDNRTMAISRIPIFFIGLVAGLMFVSGTSIKHVKMLVIISVIFMIGEISVVYVIEREMLRKYAIFWLPFILITPGLSLGLACLINRIKQNTPPCMCCNNMILRFLGCVGCLSFEMYLIHIAILPGFSSVWQRFITNTRLIQLPIFIVFIVLSLILSRMLKMVVDTAMDMMSGKN